MTQKASYLPRPRRLVRGNQDHECFTAEVGLHPRLRARARSCHERLNRLAELHCDCEMATVVRSAAHRRQARRTRGLKYEFWIGTNAGSTSACVSPARLGTGTPLPHWAYSRHLGGDRIKLPRLRSPPSFPSVQDDVGAANIRSCRVGTTRQSRRWFLSFWAARSAPIPFALPRDTEGRNPDQVYVGSPARIIRRVPRHQEPRKPAASLPPLLARPAPLFAVSEFSRESAPSTLVPTCSLNVPYDFGAPSKWASRWSACRGRKSRATSPLRSP